MRALSPSTGQSQTNYPPLTQSMSLNETVAKTSSSAGPPSAGVDSRRVERSV